MKKVSNKRKYQRYSDNDFINILKEAKLKLGRAPLFIEISQADSISDRFGSWNSALERAGLQIRKKNKQTKYYCIKKVKDFSKKYGRSPGKREMKNIYGYLNHFGGWSELLIAAGLEPNVYPEITREMIIESIRAFVKTNGRVPKFGEIEHSDSAQRIFKKWNNAILDAGFNPKVIYGLSDEYYLNILRNYFVEHKKVPILKDISEHNTLRLRFRSWNNALRKAGLKINNSIKVPEKYISESNEELLQIYYEYSKKIGKGNTGATIEELKDCERVYNIGGFIQRIGGVNNARRELGMKILNPGPVKYSDINILKSLKEEKKTMGRRLKNNEIDLNKNLPPVSTIRKYFLGLSMEEIWGKVGC